MAEERREGLGIAGDHGVEDDEPLIDSRETPPAVSAGFASSAFAGAIIAAPTSGDCRQGRQP